VTKLDYHRSSLSRYLSHLEAETMLFGLQLSHSIRLFTCLFFYAYLRNCLCVTCTVRVRTSFIIHHVVFTFVRVILLPFNCYFCS
jgi:hypothetical protein